MEQQEFVDYGIYTCPIWGASFKSSQQEQIDSFDHVITVEDHLLDCGFGSWLRESVSDLNSHLKITHKGLTKNVIGKVGSENYLYNLDNL